jgi:mannose-6-phosphate isomerase-like protein (cupin superfamily)
MCKQWLEVALRAYKICGGFIEERKNFSLKEKNDLRILQRGAYAKSDINLEDQINNQNIFLAMPNVEDQLVSKDFGMFVKYNAKKIIKKNEPIMINDVNQDAKISELMDKRFLIKDMIKAKINTSRVIVPKDAKIEISHHYGIDNFFETGAVLFHIINKEYSKMLVMMFKGQKYPEHYHVKKNETYLILEGDLRIKIEDKIIDLKKGDTYTVKNNIIHSFETSEGVIFEEIATSYIVGDSKYTKELNSNRKTLINIFE